MLADRFPGVFTPKHSYPAITGDFSLHDPKPPRRRSGGEPRRQIHGD
jgi:hypothetical protein